MYNRYICPDCGAHLDPGESCDCQDEVRQGTGEEQGGEGSRNQYSVGFQMSSDDDADLAAVLTHLTQQINERDKEN